MAEPKKSNGNNDEQRRQTNVNWKARQRKQKVFGFFKFLIFMAILGAGTGAAIVFWPQISALINPPKPTESVAKPTEPEPKELPPPPIEKKIETPPPQIEKKIEPPVETVKKIEPPPPTYDDASETKAQSMIADGRKQLETYDEKRQHFNFIGARETFGKVAALKAKPETLKLAAELARKAEQFDRATRHIQIGKFCAADESIEVTMNNGHVWHGLKLSEDREGIRLQVVPVHNPATLGESTFNLPKLEIVSVKVVPLSERQANFRKLIAEVERQLPEEFRALAGDYYDIMLLSKRLGLGKECVKFLTLAHAKSEQNLDEVFRKVVIDRTIATATLQLAAGHRPYALNRIKWLENTFPGDEIARDEIASFRMSVLDKVRDNYQATISLAEAPKPSSTAKNGEVNAKRLVAEASSTEKGDGAMIVVNTPAVTSSGEAGRIAADANSAFDKALGFYKQYQQGTRGNNNQVLKDAANYFEQAIDLYDKALQLDRNNAALESRQQEANMLRYACMKYQTLR